MYPQYYIFLYLAIYLLIFQPVVMFCINNKYISVYVRRILNYFNNCRCWYLSESQCTNLCVYVCLYACSYTYTCLLGHLLIWLSRLLSINHILYKWNKREIFWQVSIPLLLKISVFPQFAVNCVFLINKWR